jgi:chromate transporter
MGDSALRKRQVGAENLRMVRCGAIAGAMIVLGQRAIIDLPTAAIAVVSLGLLWRSRVSEPLLVLIAGLAGLVLSPLVR